METWQPAWAADSSCSFADALRQLLANEAPKFYGDGCSKASLEVFNHCAVRANVLPTSAPAFEMRNMREDKRRDHQGAKSEGIIKLAQEVDDPQRAEHGVGFDEMGAEGGRAANDS
ncbi:hypothetical protein CEK25_005585 [Fusarium fujikuroi]|nr:hypothetical protein CEK25_005585 [Fusarium fujikuroi]